MKIIFVRREDYWIFPLSVVGALFVEAFFYTGVFWLRLISGLLGFSILFFMYYIIGKNYGKAYAVKYLLIVAIAILLTVAVLYYLTK